MLIRKPSRLQLPLSGTATVGLILTSLVCGSLEPAPWNTRGSWDRRLQEERSAPAEVVDARADLRRRVDRVAHWNTVIVSQTNCGYLPFAENWLHHAAHANLTNYLIVTEDEPAANYLEARHPGHVLPAHLLSATRPNLAATGDKFRDFGSKDFIKLACARPVYLSAILALGYNVLWVDLDAALLMDPFKHLPWLYEYVGVDDELNNRGRDSNYLCTCFMFLRPTDRVRSLLSEWNEACERGGEGIVGNQILFNRVMRSRQNGTVPLDYYILPKQLYPDGWNMRRSRGENCGRFWRAPAWSHANYISGFDNKRQHFRDLGLWQGDKAEAAAVC
ncbi:hypothetical protein WJX73_006677 [Symbiochloris irregularis]|uniref:Nucleotide-diphospho-sugar transferase domain-containing protein n=1 Tax=Symbiochloris irregularis TaxID=706552 RepID=A0AAW1PSQ8_9CHLO